MSSQMHISSLAVRSFNILILFSSASALKNLLFFFAFLGSATSSASWISCFRYSSATSAWHRSVSVSRFSRWSIFFIVFSHCFAWMYLNMFT